MAVNELAHPKDRRLPGAPLLGVTSHADPKVPPIAGLGLDKDLYATEERINAMRAMAVAVAVVLRFVGVDPHFVLGSVVTGALAATALGVGIALRRRPSEEALRRIGIVALVMDSLVCAGFMWDYLHGMEPSLWTLTILIVFEAALRYDMLGAFIASVCGGLATAAWSLARGLHVSQAEAAGILLMRFTVLLIVGAGAGAVFQRLDRQKRSLASAVERSRDLVSFLDRSGTILYVNGASTELLGWSPEELVGRRLTLVGEGSGTDASAVLGSIDCDAGDGALLRRHVRRDGDTVWLEHNVVSRPDDDIVRVVSRDVTETQETAGQLEVVDQRYRSMFDNHPDLVFALDPDGTVTSVNPAAQHLLGFAPEELTGASFEARVAEQSEPAARAQMQAVARGDARTFETSVLHKDGHEIDVMVTAVPILVEGEVAGVFVIVKDQTARIRAGREQAALLREMKMSEDRLEQTLEDSRTVRFEYDLVNHRLNVSDNFAKTLKLDRDNGEVVGMERLLSRVHPEDSQRLAAKVGDSISAGRRLDEVARLVDRHGETIWVNIRCRVRRDEAGRAVRLEGIVVDVTDRERATEALRQRERAFASTIEATTDAFIGVSAEGVITDWNRAAEQIYGWSREEAVGSHALDLVMPPESHNREEDWLEPALREGVVASLEHNRRFETSGIRKNGERFPIELTVTSITLDGEDGFRAFVRDITDRKAAEAELERQALVDGLTGLPNRSLLMDRMSQALARMKRGRVKLAVLFVDVDRFKIINDSLGHSAGDRLLATLGSRLPGTIRANDTVARFGGDELVVMCEEVSEPDEATEVAQRVMRAISTPLELDGREITLTASIGMVITSDWTSTPDELIRDADAAMYRAKAKGRNRIEMFDDSLRAQAVVSLDLDRGLRHALERDQLRVEFQPVVSLARMQKAPRIRAAEALVRWEHPDLGVVPPDDFIGQAEETGLIIPIGRWIIKEACRHVAAWRANPSLPDDMSVLVNLSGWQLTQPDLASQVAECLEEHGLDSSAVGLEITESILLEEAAPSMEVMGRLRDMGVRIFIDDFGTGYSSLVYLRRYPVDGLKIDRMFVAGLGSDAIDAAIVASIVNLAHELGLEVIAEGVERRDQARSLAKLGCDLGQGYLWSPARDGAELGSVAEQLAGVATDQKAG